MSGYFFEKVAAVTGAASGIGLGLTEEILARGAAAVFMGDLKEENLARESARLEEKYPGKIFPVVTDVTRLEDVQNLVGKTADFNGKLDFIFNNAGVGMTLPTEQITFEIWRFLVDLNIMGVAHGTYCAIPIMKKQGCGHIVNAGSVAGLVPVAYQAVYAATKAAVISMTESLQYELEADGLSFSAYCPGNVVTGVFGEVAPPPDSISVREAVGYILGGVEEKKMLIPLPESVKGFYDLYRLRREDFDKFMRNMAAERRENYRTKGSYV